MSSEDGETGAPTIQELSSPALRDYQIITAINVDELNDRVCRRIDEGWMPIGAAVPYSFKIEIGTLPGDHRKSTEADRFMQTMVRYE